MYPSKRDGASESFTFRLVSLVPVNSAAEYALADDAGDFCAASLDVVVEEDLVQLVGHVV